MLDHDLAGCVTIGIKAAPDIEPLATLDCVAVPPAACAAEVIAGRHQIEFTTARGSPLVRMVILETTFSNSNLAEAASAKFFLQTVELSVRTCGCDSINVRGCTDPW